MAELLGTSGEPQDARAEIERELEPGERIVWAGRPLAGALMRSSLPIVIFGIPFTGFAIFWMAMAGWGASKSGDVIGKVFPLFGLPFLLVGCAMLLSPLFARSSANRTAYGITDRRAIVRKGKTFGGIEVQSFHPDRLTGMTKTQRNNGSGDLIFETFTTRNGSGHTTVRRGFTGLADVRHVEDILRKTLLR